MSNSSQEWNEYTVEEISAEVPHALAMGPFGSNITKDNFVDHGVPIIRGINLSWGRFNIEDFVFLTDAKADELRSSNAFPGDLVFTHRGTLGQVGLVPDYPYPRYVISQSQMKVTFNESLALPLFMFYYFSSIGKTEILKHISGSGVPAIASPLTTLRNIRVKLPQISIQGKIAFILGSYDDLIENNRRRIQILEEMARTLYQEWFVHFRYPGYEDGEMEGSELGIIPEGWRVTPFTEMAEILGGGTPRTNRPEYWNGEIPFFTPRDIKGGIYILDTERHITRLGVDNCKSDDFPKDTVFITARGTVGRVVMPAIPMAMSQTSYALKGRNGIRQFFVFFKTLECIEQLKKMTHGAVFDTIITDTFQRLKISLPPLDIIDSFCTVVSPFLDLILNQMVHNSVLEATRDILLPRLVSGQLDVSNLKIEVAKDNHQTSKYSDQSTLDQWLDGDDKDGPS